MLSWRWAFRPAPTPMIRSSAALPVVFGERPPVRRLGQRQGVGQEPPSARLSEGRPGYLVGSRLHLHRRPALITVTPPTDIRVTATLLTVIQARDTRPTHHRDIDIQATQVLRVTPLHRSMDTSADLGSRITPFPPATDTPATRNIPPSPVRQPMGTRATQDIPTIPVLRAMVPGAAWNSRATSVLPAMNHEPTWATRRTLVPLAMNTPGSRKKPRCRRLWAMNTRAHRRITLTPPPVIDFRRPSNLARRVDG